MRIVQDRRRTGLLLVVCGSCFCLGFLTRSLVSVGNPMSADRSAVTERSTILSRRSADTATTRALGAAGAEQLTKVADLIGKLQTSEDCSRFARSLLRDDAHRNVESLWSLLLARWSEIDTESMLAFVRDAGGKGSHVKCRRGRGLPSLRWIRRVPRSVSGRRTNICARPRFVEWRRCHHAKLERPLRRLRLTTPTRHANVGARCRRNTRAMRWPEF